MKASDFNEVWFVHLNYSPPLPLLLVRADFFSAKVFGGKTGNHCTGHGENYWDKFREIVRLGYVPVSVAMDLELISKIWVAPSLDSLNESIKRGVFKLIGN
jgi:hypothetical protein